MEGDFVLNLLEPSKGRTSHRSVQVTGILLRLSTANK
jgi:hypothetical protein